MAPNSRQRRTQNQGSQHAANLLPQRMFKAMNDYTGANRPGSEFPYQIRPSWAYSGTLGFSVTSSLAQNIWTPQSLCYCMGVATTAANYAALAQAFRLRSIEIWTPVQSAGSPVTCTVKYDVNGNSVIHSDTTMGTNRPAHILSRPPKRTLVRDTRPITDTTSQILLDLPAGSVVYISGTWYFNNTSTGNITAGHAALNIGEVYCQGPDAVALATSKYVAIGIPQA